MLADPAFLQQSVLSYYERVDRIVATFDQDGVSWAGDPLPIDECKQLLADVDRDGKVQYLSGPFADAGKHPLVCETEQRNTALAEASQGADWVVQVDTDEIVADPEVFMRSVRRAEASGRHGLDFPARWLYGRAGRRLSALRVPQGRPYLERCNRRFGVAASYPGAVAVRSGTTVRLARQADVPLWRVDFRPRNTDPWHPPTAQVDEVIHPRQGIWHYSWVRSEGSMRSKSRTSGHAGDMDWNRSIDAWLFRCRHPILTTLATPFRGRPDDHYRPCLVPDDQNGPNRPNGQSDH